MAHSEGLTYGPADEIVGADGLRRMTAKRIAARCGIWVLLVAALVWLYEPRLAEHMHLAFGSNVLNDDMRIQLPYFYHYSDKSLFPHDVIGRYMAEGTGELFRALYIGLAPVVDVIVLAKTLTYVTLLLTAAGLGVAANRLGGKPAAFAAVCITLGSFEFIDRTIGGMPRAFAYPCMAWSVAALAWGRVHALAVLSVIGAGFYPLLPVVGGLSLAILLLLMHADDRGSARRWSLRRRLVLLAVTGLAAGALLAPFAWRMRPYGSVIRLEDQAAFPEAGPAGRLHGSDRPPAEPFFDLAETTSARALAHGSAPLWPEVHELIETKARHQVFFIVVTLLSAAGVLRAGLTRSGRHFRRVAAFALAVGIAFELAALVDPSLVPSSRYVRYGVPPLVAIVVPSAVVGLLPRRWRFRGRFRRFTLPIWVTSFTVVLLSLIGTYSSRTFGFDVRLHENERGIAAAIGRLPPDAVVAGWPQGFMDDVTLFSKRTAFITYQTYMPYNKRMTLEMRARASAVIDAHYSSELAPLRRLRDEFHVTHFLLEPVRLHKRGHLFQPLAREIARATARLQDSQKENALAGDLGAAVVYRDTHYELVELAKL